MKGVEYKLPQSKKKRDLEVKPEKAFTTREMEVNKVNVESTLIYSTIRS